MWEIKGKDNQTKASVCTLEYNGEWMGESYVTVTIESPAPIAFAIGDYLMYRGERFEINYDPGKIKSAPQFAKGDAFKYENVKFNSLADELTRCDFLDVVLGDNQLHFTGLPKFSFYGGVQQLASRIQANLDRTYPNQWTVVVSPEYSGTKELNVSVDTQKVWDALSILVNDFETYFTIKGRTITIGAAGIPAAHLFKYGKGNGLYEIEQNAETDQAIVTRLRAYGSTRNLPHRYYNSLTGADGQKLIPDNMAVQNLMLPSFPYTTQDPFIDSANKAALGIREGTIFFDGSQEGLEEIYPSIEGMTAEQLKAAGVPCNSTGALDVIVSAEQMTDDGVGDINEGETETTATPPTFKVTLKDLGFDIDEHRTTEAATLSFKTGMLGGREFEIVGCEAIKDSTDKVTGYKLELDRVYDDSIKLWFPYKDYNAKAGDKFVLLHIEMPEVYIKAAAQRLLEAATAWLAKNDYSRSVYVPKVDEIFMARQHDEAMASGGSIVSLHDTLKEGMMLLFEDDDLNIDASIFIDQLIIKEGDGPIPTYEITLKEEKTVGRLDKMQNQIDSLAAGQGQGSGGYNASQIRSLIDAYGGTRFLSRIKDDRTAHKLATDKAFEVGEFLAGISGGFFGIDQNGDSYLEVARLYARVRAVFEELTVIKTGVLAGKQYITPGGGIVCTKVEEVTNASGTLTGWRCYFLSEQDGEKTECKFRANDQAISALFNAKTGTANKVSNHRYWRLVTAVDNDAYTDDSGNHYGYIELSATDCEAGSDTPQAGDEICQLGNRTDATRQTAIVFSTVDADSPSIKMFGGIGSGTSNAEHYSLNGKAIISFGRDATTGKVYFRLGATGATQYLEYNQDGGLTLNGKLSIGSTIGDKPLDKYFTDLIPEIPEEYDDTEIKAKIDKYKYLAEALPQDTDIIGGVVLSTLVSLGYKDSDGTRHTLAGMNGSYVPELAGRTIGSWWGGEMEDIFNADGTKKTSLTGKEATSLIRMDGSFYFANGNIGGRTDGSGWLAGDNITWDEHGAITFGNGIKIDLGGGKNTTLGGIQDTLGSVLTIVNGLSNELYPVDSTGARVDWGSPNTWAIKSVKGFFSDSFISARGANPDGGGSGSGGVYYLHELLDAAISNPASGQALIYNGTKWVNQAIQTGLDEAALASYLTTHSYATQSWVESKGYLTTHQSLADYVTLNTPQNITANKVFYGEERFVANGLTYTDPWSGIVCAIKVTGKVGITDSIKAASFIKSNGTASQFLMADGSVVTKHVLTIANNLGWVGTQGQIPTIDTLAFWNGRYNATSSNLQYCDRGRFGTMAVANAADYLARSGGSMTNTNVVTNLNADLLDGMHASSFVLDYGGEFSGKIYSLPCKSIFSGNNLADAPVGGWVSGLVLGANWNNNHYQHYLVESNNGRWYTTRQSSNGSMTNWNTLAYLTDNVASATKLQTARTIWGQSFNGTANVSGSLTGVSSIGFNGNYEFGIHNGRYVFGTTGQVGAVGANVGSLLVSNMWADATKVPTNGIYVKGDLRIGDITLSYDAANGGLHVSGGGLYADSYITARGANTSGGGSTGGGLIQQVYGSSSLGGAFSDTTLTDTFNAYTINKIRTDLINADSALSGRITSLEGGAAVSVTTTGGGNAITAISKSGTTITATKGATFLTAHQSLANYVTLNTTQTITGLKTFSAAGTTAIFNSTGTTATNVVLKTNGTQRSSIGWYNNFVFISNEPGYTGASTDKYHRLGITDAGVPQFWTNRDGSKYTLLHEGNYTTILDVRYVTALGTSGDYLTWTKNGATNNITVPYATTAAQLTGFDEHTGTTLADFDRTHTYTCQATNDLGDGISYSAILTVSAGSEHRFFQLIGGKGNPSYLRWRTTDANGKALGAVHRLLDDVNYSSVLDSRYYTESEINAKLTNGSVTKVGTATVGSTAKGIYLNGGTPTALSATVGAANRPVYMNAGTITAGTYTFGNGSGNAPISNGTLCTNLNADLLDGLHNGALTARYLNLAAFVTNCNAVPTHNGIFSWSGTNSANPATYGVLLQWSSVDNPTPGTDQHWITQLASATSNRLFYRTRINTGAWSGWSAVAFTSDNVASATKLQTARTLWGQSFNGTANVDGALTVHHTGACGVYISGGGESSYSCQASGGLRWVSGAYPDRYFIWDSSGNGNERLTILNNGSVGIGTTSPSAKLDVIGVIHSTAGMWSNGYVSARGQNTASDARLKNILQTKLLDTRSIAAAPSVLFRWKDDGREDVGSIAQYWQRIDHHLVSHRPDGYLGLDYGKAALLSVISVAKSTLNHEERIKALEKENKLLKEQIKSLT